MCPLKDHQPSIIVVPSTPAIQPKVCPIEFIRVDLGCTHLHTMVINEPSPSVIVGTIIAIATDIAASTIIIINVTLFARPTFVTFDCFGFLLLALLCFPVTLPCLCLMVSNLRLPLMNWQTISPIAQSSWNHARYGSASQAWLLLAKSLGAVCISLPQRKRWFFSMHMVCKNIHLVLVTTLTFLFLQLPF